MGILLTRFLREDSTAAAAVDRTIEKSIGTTRHCTICWKRQNYRLAFWRTATQDLGYRRFFDISTLIGLRTEHEQVFADIHDLVFRWLRSNDRSMAFGSIIRRVVDPEQYLIRLRDRVPSGWIVVEKILMPMSNCGRYGPCPARPAMIHERSHGLIHRLGTVKSR